MTNPIASLAVDMRIRIPRGTGLRFGGRYATILQIKPQGTTVHLGNGKFVTYAYDTLQDAIRRIGPE
ncbi:MULTISPECIES: hypothetical protein [Burkholderia cepacia complex]|jgi:hypothetical protein|uniref:Transposase n=1 Tax=Burkholderia vietnamiensis TaxID=60552 RepID=A0AAW7T4R2_BURVI|nr:MULTISPECIES: hypothetical protein [Burkholderia cepacia complex]EGD05476.1 hypothetical protein B1M_06200 [Burkholderia sp. TJI49]MBR8372974.1 hypothetical protein [Burkholderia cenocepacia]MBR8441899.1 hypothetical protein [Burkholderia cenocepacia]MBU9142471.1 hypothetical protein [Burkholderia multivorans]MBU9205564.1 hypothetical protein [Burkholderia multivorans]